MSKKETLYIIYQVRSEENSMFHGSQTDAMEALLVLAIGPSPGG